MAVETRIRELLDRDALRLRARRVFQRAVRYVKPRPVYRPLTVEQVLSHQTASEIVDRFNDLLYRGRTAAELNWRGDAVLKNPCDLWMIVELLQKLEPAVVIETGTHHGGSASFYADTLRTLGLEATVITVDINPKWSFDPRSKNIVSVIGYSTDAKTFGEVRTAARKALAVRPGHVMVLLDSNHSEENVSRELQLYSELVTVGSYLIVEDTNVNGHPSCLEHGPGPWEAVDGFLESRTDFIADRECERFLSTFFPRGWLKRVR